MLDEEIKKAFDKVLSADIKPKVIGCSICGQMARNRSEMCAHLIETLEGVLRGEDENKT